MRLLRTLLVLIGTTAAASAQTNAPANIRLLSLQDCIQQAVEHNLGVQIARYIPQQSLYDLRGAYSAYDPTLTISGQHDHQSKSDFFFTTNIVGTNAVIFGRFSDANENSFSSSLGASTPWGMSYSLSGQASETLSMPGAGSDSSSGAAQIQVTQPLLRNLWIDGTRLSIRLSKNRFKFSEQSLRRILMDTVVSVQRAYYDLIAARENVQVQEKALQLADQLLSENKKRVEVGAMAPLDEKQAASQFASAKADLLSARQTVYSQENLLKRLISDNYRELHDEELRPSESLAAPFQLFNLQDSWAQGMTRRPELIQTRLDLEHAGIQLKFDRNQLFPALDLFGTYGYSSGTGSREFSTTFGQIQDRNFPYYTYGAQFSIPLANWSARNRYKSGKLTVEQSLLALKDQEQTVLVEIDDDIKQAQAAYERVDATREATLYSEAALAAEQQKLENGKSTSFVVLQLQSNLTNARSAEIKALADYNKLLAKLERDQGTTLERLGIDLVVK